MTDDDINWSDVRQNISHEFGEVPGPQLENEIINAFTKNPQAVIKAAEEVAGALRAGEIHSGWPILRKRVERITNPLRNVTVPKPKARNKAIARAEQWMRNAGIHFDSQTELEDELFGDRGILRDWPDLRDQILELWREARPIGIRLERQQIVRLGQRLILAARAARIVKRHPEPFVDTDLPAELQPQETT